MSWLWIKVYSKLHHSIDLKSNNLSPQKFKAPAINSGTCLQIEISICSDNPGGVIT